MIRLFWDINIQGIYSYNIEGFMTHFIILLKALVLATIFMILAKLGERSIYSVTAVISCYMAGSYWILLDLYLYHNLGKHSVYNYQQLNVYRVA